MNRLARKVGEALWSSWAPVIQAFGGTVPSVESIVTASSGQFTQRTIPLLRDTSLLVSTAIRNGKRILMEGAQGTLLDIDHGTYPYVTSSSPVAGGAAVGAGIGPNRIDTVIGITKAYATRVGGGPFPTELDDSDGIHLREAGAEFGSVTGRPRRTGWLDLPALNYAARVNGLDGMALTKLDVLTGLKRIRVCVAYDTPDGRTRRTPPLKTAIDFVSADKSIRSRARAYRGDHPVRQNATGSLAPADVNRRAPTPTVSPS